MKLFRTSDVNLVMVACMLSDWLPLR